MKSEISVLAEWLSRRDKKGAVIWKLTRNSTPWNYGTMSAPLFLLRLRFFNNIPFFIKFLFFDSCFSILSSQFLFLPRCWWYSDPEISEIIFQEKLQNQKTTQSINKQRFSSVAGGGRLRVPYTLTNSECLLCWAFNSGSFSSFSYVVSTVTSWSSIHWSIT